MKLKDLKIETVSFRTGFKPFIELVSKNENLTLTMFINDCIREQLATKTDFLADMEARKITAEEMGIPAFANTAIWDIQAIMASEKYEEYKKRHWENHARIKKELSAFFRDDGVLGENGELVEAPIILD